MGLPPESKPSDQALVSTDVFAAKIIQKTASLRHHRHQSPSGMYVFSVRPKVVGHLANALGEHCDLQFRGTGIGFVRPVFFDDSLLDVRVQHY